MTDKPSNRQSREIGLILDSLEGWEKGEGKRRFGNYASQRFWCKNETAYFKRIDDDYVEIVDLE